jgi:acetyl esterase/lipase
MHPMTFIRRVSLSMVISMTGAAAAIGADSVTSAVPSFTTSPPAAPRTPVGAPLLGPGVSAPVLTATYPNGVEALFDLTYAQIPGYRPLTLDLYRVPKGEPKPAVVFVHGGSFLNGSPRANTPLWGGTDALMAYVASKGFVVVPITYRFSSEAKWPAQLEDTKAAIRWLRANAAKYGIDAGHVGVWGESAGGGVASMAGTTCGVSEFDGVGLNLDQSSCAQASVIWYGTSDMNKLDAQAPANAVLIHNSPDSSQSKVLGCVLYYECPASVVAKANPIAYVGSKRTSAAFLIMHGDDDKAVSWKQGQILYDALKASGYDATLIIVPGVDHYFVSATQAQAKQILDEVVAFLQRTLSAGTPAGK